MSGDLRLLPDPASHALEQAVDATVARPRHLTLAIGYDARDDIVAGVRAAVLAGAGGLSGEQRISGFFPWQTQHAEIHVSPRMWPAFTERDLDRALADYAARQQHRVLRR